MTMMAASHLSLVLIERAEYWEAEALLKWHVRLVVRVNGPGSSEAREVSRRLAECLRRAGDTSVERELQGECGNSCASCKVALTCASSRVNVA